MITLLARILLVIDMKERRNPRDNDGKVEKAKVGTIFKQLSRKPRFTIGLGQTLLLWWSRVDHMLMPGLSGFTWLIN